MTLVKLAKLFRESRTSKERNVAAIRSHVTHMIAKQDANFGRLKINTSTEGMTLQNIHSGQLLAFINELDQSGVPCRVTVQESGCHIDFHTKRAGVLHLAQVQYNVRALRARGPTYHLHLRGNITADIFNKLLANVILPESEIVFAEHARSGDTRISHANFHTVITGSLAGSKAEIRKHVTGLLSRLLANLKKKYDHCALNFTVDEKWSWQVDETGGELILPPTPQTLALLISWLPQLAKIGVVMTKPRDNSVLRVQMSNDAFGIGQDKPILTAAQLRAVWPQVGSKDSRAAIINVDTISASVHDRAAVIRSVVTHAIQPYLAALPHRSPIAVYFGRYDSIQL